MLTGADLSLYFDDKIDQSYSAYLDDSRKNSIFRDAYIRLLEERYANLSTQKNYDEITNLIKTNESYTINNNRIYTANLKVTDVAIFDATHFTITTLMPHNFITGDSVTISGVTGTLTMTQANATFIIANVTTYTFRITVASATGVYTADTGVVTGAKIIADYYHLLTVKCKFSLLSTLTITGATNTSPIKVTVSEYNNLRSGDLVTIASVGGNTAANATSYIKKVSSKVFQLYSDAKLTTPVAGNGVYTSGGTLTNVYDEYAKPYYSDRKISAYGIPNVYEPKFETAESSLIFYPTTETCSEITIDYIRTQLVEIDVADDTIDLELYYNSKFLYALIDRAMQIFTVMLKDGELYKLEANEIQINP